MSSNIKKNLGLQSVYQILNTVLPLITAPYLARVLGASMLGVFSYTTSIVAYFALFAMLGTINYGTRTIAECKDDRAKTERVFWEIYTFQLIMTLITIGLYVIYLIFFCKDNITISIIQLITLIACLFDINWLFFGMENFSITVTRSIVIKIVTVLLIILLVKQPEDLWIYTVIMLGGTLLSQLVLWVYLPRYVSFVRVKWKDVVEHIKPNFILFIPLLAMSVYHTMDKTMLGAISSYEQCGFYYNADKVINIPICVLNGVGTVMLPRMTALFNSNKRKEADHLFIISLEGIAVVSCAMAFGIAAVSKEFVPIFFGKGYDNCVLLTIILAPVLIIKGFSNTARTQYLVPLKMESVFTKSVFAGAITNLVFNLLLIPKLGALGAVIGTLLAELVSCTWQFIYMSKTISLKKCFLNSTAYVLFGIIMFAVIRMVSIFSYPILIKLIFEICLGAVIYIVACLTFWKLTNSNMYKIVFGDFIMKMPLLRKIL